MHNVQNNICINAPSTHTYRSYTLVEFVRCFPQSLQADSGIVPRLGHYRFLPNPCPIIIHLATQCSLDTKKPLTVLREVNTADVTKRSDK
jgi:hypothetical protein